MKGFVFSVLALALMTPLIGCASSSYADYKPTAAAIFATDLAAPAPAPTPDIKPNPKPCPNCLGTGFVGDGVVRVKCAACDGDGVARPPKVIPVAAPVKVTYKQVCENGVCKLVPVNAEAKSAKTYVQRNGTWYECPCEPGQCATGQCATGCPCPGGKCSTAPVTATRTYQNTWRMGRRR